MDEKTLFFEKSKNISEKVLTKPRFSDKMQKNRSKIKEKTFFFGKYKNISKKLLTNPALRDKIHHVPNGTYALVAQLDRVTDYESVGRGFESLPSHQKMP